jgi:hypothetical protein
MITAADDSFHPPATADLWWTETAWFAFAVPERGIAGALYPLFRPNLGVCSAAVYVWDARADAPWEVLYGKTFWHLPLPPSLERMSLACGLSYECLEPLRRYRLRYADGDDVALDLLFEALLEPHAVGGGGGERGHFDQPGRVRGSLRLRGEEIAVDCLEMRDRSWGPRPDAVGLRAGYAYATASERDGFHVMSIFTGERDQVVAGYLLRDGCLADVVSGTREVVERDRGRPLRVRVSAVDALGRELQAEGRCASRLAFQASPGLFAWMSLTHWRFGEREAWGEDQDVWPPSGQRR